MAGSGEGGQSADQAGGDEGVAPPPSKPDAYVGFYGGCRPVTTFEKLRKIGEGTYGSVYKARDLETGEIVALKKVKMERERDGLPLTSLREIKILKKISHPNIVHLKEVVVGRKVDSIFLVFEYCEHDLSVLFDSRSRTPFTESEIKCLFLQLLRATAYMHDHHVIHRDIKLANLLYTNQGQIRLCDFGLARGCGEPVKPMTPKVVTLWYRAPEVLLGVRTYTVAIDMWSLGCVLGEFLSHRPLFPAKAEPQQVEMIFELLGAPNDRIWPGWSKLPLAAKLNIRPQQYNLLSHRFPTLSDVGLDLLNGLLTYDPDKRLTAHEALEHPWFREAPLPKMEAFMPTFPTPNDDHGPVPGSSSKAPSGARGSSGVVRDPASVARSVTGSVSQAAAGGGGSKRDYCSFQGAFNDVDPKRSRSRGGT